MYFHFLHLSTIYFLQNHYIYSFTLPIHHNLLRYTVILHTPTYTDSRKTSHYHRVTISCVECSSCGRSHALLPSVIIPYSSYSIQFVVSLLFHHYKKTYKSVAALCLHFEIAVSTFYRIYHCFMADSLFLKGVKAELTYFDSIALISYLSHLSFIEITSLQRLFFVSYGNSCFNHNHKYFITLLCP